MVPLESHMDNISGVELVESSSSYRMLTQMDVIRYLHSHGKQELSDVLSCTVRSAGAITDTILAVTHRTKAIDAIRCLRSASLLAVPIVEASDIPSEGHRQLINVSGIIYTSLSSSSVICCQLSLGTYASVIDFDKSFSI